ncbi:hypothetical protein OSTOST_07222 [Ostertagia ostertagi]
MWKPKFLTLTQSELLFYEAVPQMKTEWAEPRITRPLVATRVVQTTSRTAPVMKGLSDVISLRIRTGTQNGVRTHTLRVETHADLAQWVRAIVLGTYEACSETSQVTSPCICRGENCELVVNLDTGISLSGPNREIIWQHPFESIRATGDDGGRFLWIDFGPPSGEQNICELVTKGTGPNYISKTDSLHSALFFGDKSLPVRPLRLTSDTKDLWQNGPNKLRIVSLRLREHMTPTDGRGKAILKRNRRIIPMQALRLDIPRSSITQNR